MAAVTQRESLTAEHVGSDLAALLAEARELDDAAQALLEYVAKRWDCRAIVLGVPGGSGAQVPRLYFRGVTAGTHFQFADAATAWTTLSLRHAGAAKSQFLWLPIPGGEGGSSGFLVLFHRDAPGFSAADCSALTLAGLLAGPAFVHLRRTNGLKRLLDQQASERQGRDVELTCLNRVLALLNQGPLERVFPMLAVEVRRLVSFDYAAIFIWSDASPVFTEVCGVDSAGSPQPRLDLPPGDDLMLSAIRRQRATVRWDDLDSGEEQEDLVRLRRRGYRSALLEPLRVRGRCHGALVIASRQPHHFRSLDIHRLVPVLAHLANTLAQAEDNRTVEESRRFWEQTFDAFPEGVLVLGKADAVLRLNAAARTVLCAEGVAAEGRPLEEILGESGTTGAAGNGASNRIRRGGHEYLLTRSPAGKLLRDAGGAETIAVLREIASPGVSDDDLAQGEKMSLLGQLMAGIAHELNNPLAAVIGYATLLRRHPPDERVARQLASIEEGAVRCREIVRGLLNFARKHPSERVSVYLPELVERTCALLNYQLSVSNVQVAAEFAAEFPAVQVDEYQIQQVLVNLIVNAFQAISEARGQGRIWVRGDMRGQEVRLRVEDDGPGLAPAVRARLFQPFVTSKPAGKGTGLGLSITRQIVENHGGRIEAVDRPGGGTVFSISLPIAPVLEPAAGPEQPADEPTLPPVKILVVDDDAAVRDLMIGVLEEAGAQPVPATTGREAIAALEKSTFEAVISDLRMPNLDGRGLHDWIARKRPGLLARLIFTTGDTVNEASGAFLKETRAAVVPKPFDIGALVRLVAAVLAGAGAGGQGAAAWAEAAGLPGSHGALSMASASAANSTQAVALPRTSCTPTRIIEPGAQR